MKMRNIIIILLILPICIFGQKSAEEIKSEVKSFVKDSTLDQYWKKVYETGINSEDGFLKDELRLFYYSQGLKSVKLTPFPSLLLNKDRMKMIRAANSNRCKKAIQIGGALIEKNPFDLTTLVYYSMCLDKAKGDIQNVCYSRMIKIVESIFETGDGASPMTSIKIANIGDDEVLVGFLGFRGSQVGEKIIDGKIYPIWEDSQGNLLYFEYVFIFI